VTGGGGSYMRSSFKTCTVPIVTDDHIEVDKRCGTCRTYGVNEYFV
jgi:hypothetical protein